MGFAVKSFSLSLIICLLLSAPALATPKCFQFDFAWSANNDYASPYLLDVLWQETTSSLESAFISVGSSEDGFMKVSGTSFVWDGDWTARNPVAFQYCLEFTPGNQAKNLTRLLFSSAQFLVFHGFCLLLTLLMTLK